MVGETAGKMLIAQRRVNTEGFNANDDQFEPYDLNKLQDDEIQGSKSQQKVNGNYRKRLEEKQQNNNQKSKRE